MRKISLGLYCSDRNKIHYFIPDSVRFVRVSTEAHCAFTHDSSDTEAESRAP